MKSQEQIIGYILLGIVISSISIAAYNYIVPMIQKSSVRNVALLLEDNIGKLSEVLSSTGLRYSRTSFELEAPNSQIEILQDLIKLKLKVPIGYYSFYVKVPINYNEPVICYNNTFPIIVGNNYSVCFDDSMLYLYISNNNNITIVDIISNKSIVLPLGNYKNFITSLAVFDITYNGTHIVFTLVYPTGIYKISPACIANVYQAGTDISYEVTCRPLIDLATKKCYWIKISPYRRSAATIRDKIILSINYNYYEDVIFNSTICDSVRLIDVYVSIFP